DEPALAIGARAAAERDGEREVQGRHFPVLRRARALQEDAERREEVVGRIVLAVLVLDAGENRELASGSQMHLVLSHAVDDVVVDALAVPSARILARLPIPFEDVFHAARGGVEARLWRLRRGRRN